MLSTHSLLAIPRRPETIAALLDGHWRVLNDLRAVAVGFITTDLPPLFVVDDVIQPRELNLPPNLVELMTSEAVDIRALEYELAASRALYSSHQ